MEVSLLPMGIPDADFIMPFGKYKGISLSKISETDKGYLAWMARDLTGSIQKRALRIFENK